MTHNNAKIVLTPLRKAAVPFDAAETLEELAEVLTMVAPEHTIAAAKILARAAHTPELSETADASADPEQLSQSIAEARATAGCGGAIEPTIVSLAAKAGGGAAAIQEAAEVLNRATVQYAELSDNSAPPLCCLEDACDAFERVRRGVLGARKAQFEFPTDKKLVFKGAALAVNDHMALLEFDVTQPKKAPPMYWEDEEGKPHKIAQDTKGVSALCDTVVDRALADRAGKRNIKKVGVARVTHCADLFKDVAEVVWKEGREKCSASIDLRYWACIAAWIGGDVYVAKSDHIPGTSASFFFNKTRTKCAAAMPVIVQAG